MKDLLTNAFIFAVGAIIGSAVTWKLIKTKYEQIAQEEIDSVKETFSRLHDESTDKEEKAKMVECAKDLISISDKKEKSNMKEYASKIKEYDYVNYSDNEKEVSNVKNHPFVISPEEFGEMDYSMVSLVYYADGVLANDCDEIIEDVENTVGTDFPSHFGEYEDDSVFVRNDTRKCDYEILRDKRKFSEVAAVDEEE